MVKTWIPKIQVNEWALVINNHDVVHQVHVIVPIKLNLIGDIISKFTSMDAINEPNATVKLWYNSAQHNFFKNCGSLDFIPNCTIDALSNEDDIFTNYNLQPFP
jgi:hypothetical protein